MHINLLLVIFYRCQGTVYEYEGSPLRNRTFFFNLLLYLQLNQTCLLQSTPLHSWYTTPNFFSSSGTRTFFSSSGTRPGTCFAGWREGPLTNFLLSPLPSEIGELLPVYVRYWLCSVMYRSLFRSNSHVLAQVVELYSKLCQLQDTLSLHSQSK